MLPVVSPSRVIEAHETPSVESHVKKSRTNYRIPNADLVGAGFSEDLSEDDGYDLDFEKESDSDWIRSRMRTHKLTVATAWPKVLSVVERVMDMSEPLKRM